MECGRFCLERNHCGWSLLKYKPFTWSKKVFFFSRRVEVKPMPCSLCYEWHLLILKWSQCHFSQTFIRPSVCSAGCWTFDVSTSANKEQQFIFCTSAQRIGDTFSTDKTNNWQENKLEARASKDSVRVERHVCMHVRVYTVDHQPSHIQEETKMGLLITYRKLCC